MHAGTVGKKGGPKAAWEVTRSPLSGAAGRGPGWRVMKTVPARQPHFDSPQARQVMQPSIMTTAAVLHLTQSWAPSG